MLSASGADNEDVLGKREGSGSRGRHGGKKNESASENENEFLEFNVSALPLMRQSRHEKPPPMYGRGLVGSGEAKVLGAASPGAAGFHGLVGKTVEPANKGEPRNWTVELGRADALAVFVEGFRIDVGAKHEVHQR